MMRSKVKFWGYAPLIKLSFQVLAVSCFMPDAMDGFIAGDVVIDDDIVIKNRQLTFKICPSPLCCEGVFYHKDCFLWLVIVSSKS